jgi:N-acetylmuramoyl-L-alanine amidase
MRKITHLVLHCTGTPQTTTVESIKRYWKNVKGWKKPGYHFIILADGTVVNLLPIEQISNGVQGHNANSIHICYIGGIDAAGNSADNRTLAQMQAMVNLIRDLRTKFPDAIICGHRDFPGVTKRCPSFNVAEWLVTVGIN